MCVTFALCALFFEVTAIQFWSISYFQQVMKVCCTHLRDCAQIGNSRAAPPCRTSLPQKQP